MDKLCLEITFLSGQVNIPNRAPINSITNLCSPGTLVIRYLFIVLFISDSIG